MTLPEGFQLADMDRLPADPVQAVVSWLEEAHAYAGRRNPNAAALATCGHDGQPSARMMLLKDIDATGAVVYTNLESKKGIQLSENPRASLLMHWDALGRQVRIEGGVSRVSADEADTYFASRPWGSRIGAVSSDQSRPLGSRDELAQRVDAIASEFPQGSDVPMPAHWTGLRISLDLVELWQEGSDRLHDRIQYKAIPEGGWVQQRLWP